MAKNTVHLAAPGFWIYSTFKNGSYEEMNGTSMAAPHVTGVAALIKSIRPDLSAQEIKALILNNVDLVDELEDKCITGGRLNAYKAVRAATEPQTFTGDVDGDGRADVILSRRVNGKRAFTVYRGKSNGGFTNSTTTQSTRNFFYDDPAFVGDFNGDGLTDVVIHWSSGGDRQLLVYISKGDGTFYEGANLSSTRFHNANQFPCSFFVSDVNNDNKDDFIVTYRDWNGNRCALVYKGTASSPYLIDATNDALVTTMPYRYNDIVMMGDMNGDNRADLVVHWAQNGKEQFTIFTGTTTGTFNAGTTLSSTHAHDPANYPEQNFIADVNGDGYDDIVSHWSNMIGQRCSTVYLGKAGTPYVSDAVGTALITGDIYSESEPVMVGDVNGDNRYDLIVQWVSSGDRQLRTYTANANGTYNAGINTSTSNSQNPIQYAGTFLIADVNGDGRDDYIVKWKSSSDTVRLLVYRGNADGSFQSAVKTTPLTSVPYYNAA